jgi:hypothetical protein
MKIALVLTTALSIGYGAWQIETVEEGILGFDTNPTSIAITGAQKPTIAYVARPDVETDRSIVFARPQSSIWAKDVVLQEYLESSLADLCLDYADAPYIGVGNMGPYGLVFIRGTGATWIVDTIIDNSKIEAVAFNLRPPQFPSFAYCRIDSTGHHLYYASWDTSGWLIQPALENMEAVKATDLTHRDSIPYVSFIGQYQGITQGLVCANRAGGSWSAETLAMVSADAQGRTSILIDQAGHPHIFCYGYLIKANKNGVIHCFDAGSGWQAELVDSLGASWWNCPCGACIDRWGKFHLVYTSKQPAGKELSLCYAYNNGTNWQTEKIVTSTDTLISFCGASIAVDSQSIAHVSFRYTDITTGWAEIRYARRDRAPAAGEKSFPTPTKIVAVSPNIANDKFTVRLDRASGPVTILLYDQSGKRIARLYEGEPKNLFTLSSRALVAGVYFIAVETPGQRFVKKFICVR